MWDFNKAKHEIKIKYWNVHYYCKQREIQILNIENFYYCSLISN